VRGSVGGGGTAKLSLSYAPVKALDEVVVLAEGGAEGDVVPLLLRLCIARTGRQQDRICCAHAPPHTHTMSK
jgi:hypothetical protein